MAFTGYFGALALKDQPCGLFSIADVTRHSGTEADERWVRGFDYEIHRSFTLSLVPQETTTDVPVWTAPASGSDWLKYVPFYIESSQKRTGLGAGPENYDSVIEHLEIATQQAVERELWFGVSARAASNSNVYLAKDTATVLTTAAESPEVALQIIEQGFSNSVYGAAGVIHMTRDVASALGSRLLWKDGQVTTRLGTQVVIGSGYTGDGPFGATGAAASATNKWIYGTGPIAVHLGEKELLNVGPATGFKSTTNDLEIVVNRPAAAYFDPIYHNAAQVTVPS